MIRHRALLLLTALLAPAALAETPPASPPNEPPAAGAAMGAAPASEPSSPTQAAPAQEGTPPKVEAVSKAPPAPTAPKPVVNRWTSTLYGFVELDTIYDTRQGLGEVPGNPVLPHGGTYGGYDERATFSIRNSRLGFRFSSPEWRSMKASGMIETDFFGNAPNAAGGGNEGGLFNNAGLRVRHAMLRLETPYVDLLAGQYWQLFGWQPHFHPNTVEVQGVPGEVYSRSAQLRLSRTFKTQPVNLEIAVAAARPPQRDAGLPDGQGGVRLVVNEWRGVRTGGSTGTSLDAAAIGVSGVLRRFELNTPVAAGQTADPRARSIVNGWGVSVDGLVPVIPATLDDRSNALTLTGSWVRGRGIQDLYSGFTNGGTSATTLAGSSGIDAGLVAFDANNDLRAMEITTFIVGAQYYLPIDRGSVWVAGNFSQTLAFNSDLLAGAPRGAFRRSQWADACLFWDATPAVRFGLEVAWFEQILIDDTKANNQRYQLSAFYLF